jgi:hypothetical protein
MPGRPLKQLVQRLHAIEGFHLLPARRVFEFCPPVLDPLDNAIAVSCDLRAGDAASLIGRNVGVIKSILDFVDGSLKKSLRDTKNMVAQEPYRTVAVIDDTLGEPIAWKLENVALSRPQYLSPLGKQDSGSKWYVTAALQADEFGNIFEILTENVLVSPGQHGHAARSEPQELLFARAVVQDVDGNEVDALLRKKLFRSKAAASAGLSEQNERISGILHKRTPGELEGSCSRLLTSANTVHTTYFSKPLVCRSHR